MHPHSADREAAVDLAFTMANAEAGWRDYDVALRWLDAAETLTGALPPHYQGKREAWTEALGRPPRFSRRDSLTPV